MRIDRKLMAAAGGLLLGAGLLCGCKGRTADNMQPSGDTVEVEILSQEAPAAQQPADSIIAPTDNP